MNDPLMLVGFGLQVIDGGGVICYGFSVVWNKILKVGSKNTISEIEVNAVQ